MPVCFSNSSGVRLFCWFVVCCWLVHYSTQASDLRASITKQDHCVIVSVARHRHTDCNCMQLDHPTTFHPVSLPYDYYSHQASLQAAVADQLSALDAPTTFDVIALWPPSTAHCSISHLLSVIHMAPAKVARLPGPPGCWVPVSTSSARLAASVRSFSRSVM